MKKKSTHTTVQKLKMTAEKKIILLLFFCFSFNAFSQFNETEKKEKKWLVTVNVNTVEPVSDAGFDYNALNQRIFINGHKKDKSFCVGLNIAYRIKENLFLRLSGRFTHYKVFETRDFREFYPSYQTIGFYDLDSLEIKQSMIMIAPGLGWVLGYNKLNFYAGTQLVYRKYNTISGVTTYSSYVYPSNSKTGHKKLFQTQPGGFSAGIGVFGGFSVNIYKFLSIGAELSSSYSYYKTGGDIVTIQTLYAPIYHSELASISNQTYEGFRFSSIVTTLNLEIRF